MIYGVDGVSVSAVYTKNGVELTQAYDIDGIGLIPFSLKVMTYNVGQWYVGGGDNVPADKDADYYLLQNGMIADADADILFLCEYWDIFSKSERTALSMLSQYYPYVVTKSGGGGYFGRAICSKYPITNYVSHQYSNETSRYFDSATVTVNGEEITAVVTHLNYNANRSIRVAQLDQLISFLQTLDTFICCGDYNMLDCKSTSGADYIAMMQPLLNAGFHCANCADFGFLETYSDQPTGTYTGCLDNIVTSSNIQITNALVDTSKLTDSIADKTDHMPLIAELTIN